MQLRTEILVDNLFLQYEHHEYKFRSSSADSNSFNHENRYGLIYSRYDNIFKKLDLDTYGESFFIPEVSTHDLLSVVRTTLLDKEFFNALSPMAEIYIKESPPLFGGKSKELRFGIHYSPFDFISFKVMANVLPVSESSSSGILYQVNIFKEGSF